MANVMTLLRRQKSRRKKIKHTSEIICSGTYSEANIKTLNSNKNLLKSNHKKDGDDSKGDHRSSKGAYSSEEILKNDRESFYVAKWCILRLLGCVYLMAFLGAYYQNPALIGSNGLAPAHLHMKQLQKSMTTHMEISDNRSTKSDDTNEGSNSNIAKFLNLGAWRGFLQHPTIFWWFLSYDDEKMPCISDRLLNQVYVAGLVLSTFVMLGLESWLALFLLWILNFSIVTVAGGSSFYSYGWESQLLETGFLAIFLCNSSAKPSKIILYLFRWLCFRISLGAGLIKIRGGSCWAEKTCLHYHFETQPIPSPLSFFFHFLPKETVLSRAVDLDLFVQLFSPWVVLLLPIPSFLMKNKFSRFVNSILRNLRRFGGFLQAGFMVNIMLSGNLSFLNHLTIIPALACLDDSCWPSILRRRISPTKQISKKKTAKNYLKLFVDCVLFCLIFVLSLPVVSNLLQLGGQHQVMNASFDAFRLVNTYGAFGSVGKSRYEPIISISHDDGITWHEIEFPCKPGNVFRRPCFCAPYHYRLDWNIWFIGFKPHQAMLKQRESWVFALLSEMLKSSSPSQYIRNINDNERDESPSPPIWLALLDVSAAKYFPPLTKKPPNVAKVDMYHYTMAQPLWKIISQWYHEETPIVWWTRKFEEVLIPPVKYSSHLQNLVPA